MTQLMDLSALQQVMANRDKLAQDWSNRFNQAAQVFGNAQANRFTT